jgi:hypothetical protein
MEVAGPLPLPLLLPERVRTEVSNEVSLLGFVEVDFYPEPFD